MKIKFNISAVLRVLCGVLLVMQLFFVRLPDQASNTAIAQTIGPCVVEAGSICTRDINECGNPSICECLDGYSYNAAINKCLIESISLADGSGIPVEASKCALEPDSICTLDINACAHSSICACPDGTTYSPVVGLCLTDINF